MSHTTCLKIAQRLLQLELCFPWAAQVGYRRGGLKSGPAIAPQGHSSSV